MFQRKTDESMTNATKLAILLLTFLACAACAPAPEGLSIEIDKKLLTDIEKMSLSVLDTKRKDGVTMNCTALLKGDLKIDFAQFDSQTQRTLLLGQESQTLDIDKLTPGNKIFLATAYAKDKPDNEPNLIGCAEATIEKGKKASVALVMVVYNAAP